jgi:pyridoxine 4-dehydrogenase
MRITGEGIWGPPQDRPEALRTLKRVPELGIDFIDTADSYGPDVSEELIREALYPYDGMLIATKAGFRRRGPGVWEMDGNPKRLREQAIRSCEKLGVEQIGLWQLHRIDPKVPREAQFAAVKSLLDDGIIKHAGLSEVSVADHKAAAQVFPVATGRTATIWSIAAARTCSIFASGTASASSRGFRSPLASSPRAARS